jgi:hypothetical protein
MARMTRARVHNHFDGEACGSRCYEVLYADDEPDRWRERDLRCLRCRQSYLALLNFGRHPVNACPTCAKEIPEGVPRCIVCGKLGTAPLCQKCRDRAARGACVTCGGGPLDKRAGLGRTDVPSWGWCRECHDGISKDTLIRELLDE